MDYITCEKRKNAPKINVLICEKKCEHAEICKSYLSYLKAKSVAVSLNKCATASEDVMPGEPSKTEGNTSLALGK